MTLLVQGHRYLSVLFFQWFALRSLLNSGLGSFQPAFISLCRWHQLLTPTLDTAPNKDEAYRRGKWYAMTACDRTRACVFVFSVAPSPLATIAQPLVWWRRLLCSAPPRATDRPRERLCGPRHQRSPPACRHHRRRSVTSLVGSALSPRAANQRYKTR